VKKQFVMIFVAIVISMLIIQGAFADEDFDVDEQNVFMLGSGESVEDYASVLGSATSDLVFTPVTPCRIIDTRNAGGIIAANTGRQFQVNMGNYSSQGGYAGSCNIPINPAAVAINVASTQQTGNGHIRVIVTGGGIPLAAMLNYKAGTNISNAAVVRSLETGTDDIFIYSGVSATHVVVDIMGYFAAPQATSLDVYTTSAYVSIAPGVYGSAYSPKCAAGYYAMGGGCTIQNDDRLHATRPYPTSGKPTSWECRIRNHLSTSQNLTSYVICARIPGR
jgi:hypothetical protein